MTPPLRVLMVEDREDDAQLVLRALRRGFDPTFERVETAEGLNAALERPWDVVISDWSMPNFDAMAAFRILKQRRLDLPFIIVSGTIGEETAVEAMRAGVHDFLLKDRLSRLVPAIERELREAANRREAQRTHQHLMIADRMATVGTLAAGVAHEINNPLAIILGNLNLVLQKLYGSEQETEDAASPGSIGSLLSEVRIPLEDARDASDRVREIVRDMKILSRSDEESRVLVDVQSVLDSSLRITSNEIRHRARIAKDYGPVPPVKANEARLGQVFINLLVNAAQALPEGDAERHEIRVATRVDRSGRVAVEVADTGQGIPPENLPRIFDPFFTTKPIGVGTGLGLAICHRIIAEFGGEIAVESAVGKGTTFRILLPPASPEAPVIAEPAQVPVAPSRRGRILVVDDEPMIGAAVQRMLAAEHDVTAMTQAAAALEAVRSGQRFDVILCDLQMPQMTGVDLHAELLQVAPEQAARMIFATGGAFTASARDFLDEVPNPRIEKPFDLKRLRALINVWVR